MDEKDNHRWHKEGNPAHHDKHGGGEVDGEDEGTQWSAEKNLKPVCTVVAWVSDNPTPDSSITVFNECYSSIPSLHKSITKPTSWPTYLNFQQKLSYVEANPWCPHWRAVCVGFPCVLNLNLKKLTTYQSFHSQMPTYGSCTAHSDSCVLSHNQLEAKIKSTPCGWGLRI